MKFLNFIGMSYSNIQDSGQYWLYYTMKKRKFLISNILVRLKTRSYKNRLRYGKKRKNMKYNGVTKFIFAGIKTNSTRCLDVRTYNSLLPELYIWNIFVECNGLIFIYYKLLKELP